METHLPSGQATPYRHRRHYSDRFPAQSGDRQQKPSGLMVLRGMTAFPRFGGVTRILAIDIPTFLWHDVTIPVTCKRSWRWCEFWL
jgi:hypothetical protein